MFLTMTAEMAKIQAARKRIADDIRKLREGIIAQQEMIKMLEAEDTELGTAERVLLRFAESAHGNGYDQALAAAISVAASADDPAHIAEGAKPADIPTMPAMIKEALQAAQSQGARGLEPVAMLSYIQGRWWPGAVVNNVGPIAWRMWKRGHLVKRGSVYSLPKDN